MAETGLTMTTDIQVEARRRDFVTSFAQNWNALREIMGVSRPIKKEPGTVLKSYRASLALEDGAVAEGAEIPLSKATVTEVAHSDLTIRKYGKGISIEDVDKYGPEVAIEMTDDAFKNELLGEVLGEFYEFALTGELKPEGATDFQMGVALAIGAVKNKFKSMRKDGSRVVVFVNTMDAYRYLGVAQLTVQSAFGLDYLKNFMGAETMILAGDEDIPSGTIVAIPVNNIVNYYTDPSNSGYARMGLRYTVDSDLPMLGFAVEGDYSTATGKTWAIMGHKLWAEYLDAIAVVSVGAAAAAASMDDTSGAAAYDPESEAGE